MRNEISDIKNNYATVNQLDKLKKDLESNRPVASFLTGNININKRGGYTLDSGPVGLSPAGNESLSRHSSSQHREPSKYRSLVRANEAEKSSAAALINSTLLDNEMCTALSESPVCAKLTSEAKQPTMAQIVSNGEWKTQNKPTEE
ncbi:unnamed protein product [Parnassius apollo]|uniref:(apollo) hypothetical protein n=1 Tax=Parnassius apollo TaxID=110799 RepID=A0A8S3XIW1_PARAO|nr:unnamed protein product [Parnassius apollo]